MTLTAFDAEFVRRLLRTEAAIVIDESKGYLIESRLTPIARQVGAGSVAELVASMRSPTSPDRALRDLVVDALTINETSWFRDRHPFDALQKYVVPALIDARKATRSLTVWCAAASTGQEPYSIAILLREHFPQLSGWTVKIVATDLSRSVLDRARKGVYGQLEISRGFPPALVGKYFQRQGTKFVLDPQIRRMVDIRELNLIGPWVGVRPADIVFMRNVLIYFDPATKTRLLDRMANDVLRPDGALFLGGAESTVNLTTRYRRVQEGPCGWYQPEGAKR